MSVPVIVVHGGAGGKPGATIRDEAEHHTGLAAALEAAGEALRKGGHALDAAQAAVRSLEACPLFNAGRGSVLNEDAAVEMDAAIMCGRTLAAGAVGAVSGVRHPIDLARAVMDRSPHVLMAGAGAERFAERAGLERVATDHHVTERQLERSRRASAAAAGLAEETESSLGTVGAVVLDGEGHLAAATSTGGVRGKLWGRVGDSPLIGAGTYADDRTCAVSASGDGEAIVRVVAAHDVACLMAYRGLSLAAAAQTVLAERLGPLGAAAGLIALDRSGEVATPFNTPLFFRGTRVGDDPPRTALGGDPATLL